MEVTITEIEDVKVFTPSCFKDDRGYFFETYSQRKYQPHLPDDGFVQDNESYSAERYTVRGLHYQAPPYAQDKLVRVVQGAILDVVVDARKSSPKFGHWVGVELSASNRKQLFVPKGFLHGFMTVEPHTIVAYKVTDFYHAAADGAVHWASPSLAIKWPAAPSDAVLSAKDNAAPAFDDWASPFA